MVFENKEYENAFFEEAPVGIAYVDRDDKLIKVNKALTNILGYSEAEFESQTLQQTTHPEDLKGYKRMSKMLISGVADDFEMTLRYLSKNEKVVWCRLMVFAIRDGDNFKHFVSWIIPLPNGGHYKVETHENGVVVRPTMTWLQLLKDNPRESIIFFLIVVIVYVLSGGQLAGLIDKLLGLGG